jgi:hypothetical protein
VEIKNRNTVEIPAEFASNVIPRLMETKEEDNGVNPGFPDLQDAFGDRLGDYIEATQKAIAIKLRISQIAAMAKQYETSDEGEKIGLNRYRDHEHNHDVLELRKPEVELLMQYHAAKEKNESGEEVDKSQLKYLKYINKHEDRIHFKMQDYSYNREDECEVFTHREHRVYVDEDLNVKAYSGTGTQVQVRFNGNGSITVVEQEVIPDGKICR